MSATEVRPARAGAEPARRRRPELPSSVLGLVGLIAFAALLELLPRTGIVSADYFPPFSEMVRALVEAAGTDRFWAATAETVQAWGIGLGIALLAGIGLGLLIGSVEVLRRFTASTIEFLRPVPSVALIPLAVLLLGLGLQSTLLLVVYASFWQILIQVIYGVQDVDPVARETARSYHLGRWARVRYLIWPTALPYVMTGVRLGAAVALILAVTAGLVGIGTGLGAEIALAQSSNAVPLVYGLVIFTGLLGVVVNLAARVLERRTLAWHSSVRADVGG
ncbi:ABC transporter permease subunit [Modestobacter sp. VKM Ac-2977]|uniref:ABC transporter permease n=1 Tax=Modestobacter sp. VKM Ac-2977 TaxID=3004131 RepID=UPI0022AA7BF1|nr:ABC transporter permease subunit [Modestobacter sp. VKM Ac-2977]MCZ2822083.1 ABC transporter permease subunit [Modestobacter sp. VKM Ac-2977]